MRGKPDVSTPWRGPSVGEALTSPLRRFLESAGAGSPWTDNAPIRAELFSVERLEEHARSLAAAQTATPGARRGAPVSRRLADNEAVLVTAYRDIAEAVDSGEAITPAAQWLIDNFHVVERQIRDIRADLPPSYYRQLPKLADGPFAKYPRMFSVSWAFVAHTDSLFDPEVLRRYLLAYQSVQPLTIGELWAVAITLRVVLVENLRRVARRVVDSRAGRRGADAIADRLLGAGGRPVEAADVVLPPDRPSTFPDSFLVQLVHRLRDQDPSIAPALTWLDEQLAKQGTTADAVVRDEHQRQVAGSITVRNIITSMRLISDVDWTELFERVSPVDEAFGRADGFRKMDFPTRNLYRSAVEELARGCRFSEVEVARAAIAAAAGVQAFEPGHPEARQRDPGYYLISAGRRGFEKAIGFQPTLNAAVVRAFRALGIGGYVGAGMIVAALFLAAVLCVVSLSGATWRWILLLGVLGSIPAIDLAVALVNHVVTRGVRATLLPGLELRSGIPVDLRTLVAVPALLNSIEEVEQQVERLEIHYLASPEGELHYALLSDWADAKTEHAEGDDDLLAAGRAAVARLNRRYGPAPGGDRFLLLHRRRVWNKGESRWIGWERKRGKLLELNRLLRGAQDTTFLAPSAAPTGVRYVITLDADTQLPRETVGRLIGKMAHPLNRPRLDAQRGRVVEGYAVLQPRVTPALPVGHEGSLFLRVFSSASGIDPYAAAVSDVYQDLFGEGSYTGKGIYDIDAFEAALEGRVPESTLLSHDLFEGIFARAGLASDVEVIEDFPRRYAVAALRHHRWARGDWQLLPWIIGWRSGKADHRPRGSVPAVGRWKLLDNLRRSLSPPSVVLALIAGWAMPPGHAAIWTMFILATIILPPLIPVIANIAPLRAGVTLNSHLRALRAELALALGQSILMIIFLAHQAWLMGDAIIRTLFRLTVTRRHLLQWVPSAQAASTARAGVLHSYQQMAGALVVAAVAAAVAWERGSWPLAAGFVVAWIASPGIAFWASLSPRVAARRELAPGDARTLRLIGRRTWRFFETFVTPGSQMLPPDNFQETPEPVVAHRTSPTNIGLYLLSVASACDLGWIGTNEAVERLEATLATMGRMARYRGHFLNWYDTNDLRPLDPQYVSSVDSGNLAGHLIAVANTCREWRLGRAAEQRRIDGLNDALDLAHDESRRLRELRQQQSVTHRRFDEALDRFASRLREEGAAAGGEPRLPHLFEQATALADIAREVALEAHGDIGADLQFWAEAAQACVASHRHDLDAPRASVLQTRLRSLEDVARAMALSMEFDFLLDPDRLLLSIGYQVHEGVLDPELLRSSGFRSSTRELHRHRQGRCAGAPLVSTEPCRDPRRQGRGPDLMVGLDVRIPHAFAGNASAGAEPDRTDEPAYRAAPDRLRRSGQDPMGRFGVGLQRSRPGLHLPVFQLRNSRAGPEAWAGCQRGDRTLRDGSGQYGRSASRGPQLRAVGCRWRRGPVWLLRGPGLHAGPSARGRACRGRARVHGSPSGHDDRRDLRRPAGWRDAQPLPRRADRPGDRAPVAGTGAARGLGGAAVGFRDDVRGAGARNRRTRSPGGR